MVSVSKGKQSATPSLLLATVLNKERSQALCLKIKEKKLKKFKRRCYIIKSWSLQDVLFFQVNKLPKLPIQRYTLGQQEK